MDAKKLMTFLEKFPNAVEIVPVEEILLDSARGGGEEHGTLKLAAPDSIRLENIYRMPADEKGRLNQGVFYQVRRGNAAGKNLLSIVTTSSFSQWSRWEDTNSGHRGRDYEAQKLRMAVTLLKNARDVLGELKNPEILDIFTPLTLRDYG